MTHQSDKDELVNLGNAPNDIDWIDDFIWGQERSGTIESRQLREGDRYAAVHLFTDIPDTNKVELLLENTSGSLILINAIIIRTEGRTTTSLIHNVNVDSSGTSMSPVNQRLGSGKSSNASVERDGTYSGGESTIEILLAGSSDPNIGGSSTSAGFILLEDGNNLLASSQNLSTVTGDIELAFVYTELGET